MLDLHRVINRLVTVFVQLWRTSRLRFDDPVLENAFWVQHDRASVNLVRVAWAMAIVQFVVIGTVLLRTVTYGHGVISFAYFGSAIPVILLAFASTFVARLDRWRHAVIMATLVLSTVVVNVPFQWSDAPQGWVHAANILMVCFTFGFVAVRFRLAMMHAAFITLLFEFQLHMRPGSDTLHDLYASTFYFSVLAVSALAGFLLERSLRRNFLQSIELVNAQAQADRARAQSDDLLLNILPEEVAEELKAKGEAEAKYFDKATILFTDFKGFTQMSELLSPQALVEELNTCFKAFDNIITSRGIEKIKTIGDAYMAAGGLPDPEQGSPADVLSAALEMQEFMQRHKAEREAQGKPYFEMRVGIHTGPVVAGIVGVKKFQYDIWGDTVNTASRMESSGEVGKVNISEATYVLVKNAVMADDNTQHATRQPATRPAFTFTPRGKVQAKGKGEMEMYFVQPGS